MQAPFVFQPEAHRTAALPTCGVCGKPLRGQQRKFCGDQCRSKADQHARQAIRRVTDLLSRRKLICKSAATLNAFTIHLESRPESLGARREYDASVLDELDLLLTQKGPNDSDVRIFARVRAEAIKLAFELQPSPHPDDIRHYVRALEILRDSGLEDPEDRETLLHYAWAAVHIFDNQKDWLNLARSLQALANTYRVFGDEIHAKQLTRYAWWILSEKFGDSEDPRALTVVHHSALFDLRLFRDEIEREKAERKRQHIMELAERVGTPTIWLDTHQELTGYFARDQRHADQAHEELRALRELQSRYPRPTTYGAATLLRPEIELCLASGRKTDKEKGVYLIEARYLELYKKDRHAYYFRILMTWKGKYDLSFDLPKPVYTTPLLLHLPR
jgi:hypothetical protein